VGKGFKTVEYFATWVKKWQRHLAKSPLAVEKMHKQEATEETEGLPFSVSSVASCSRGWEIHSRNELSENQANKELTNDDSFPPFLVDQTVPFPTPGPDFLPSSD
jgi:hypothetical protein